MWKWQWQPLRILRQKMACRYFKGHSLFKWWTGIFGIYMRKKHQQFTLITGDKKMVICQARNIIPHDAFIPFQNPQTWRQWRRHAWMALANKAASATRRRAGTFEKTMISGGWIFRMSQKAITLLNSSKSDEILHCGLKTDGYFSLANKKHTVTCPNPPEGFPFWWIFFQPIYHQEVNTWNEQLKPLKINHAKKIKQTNIKLIFQPSCSRCYVSFGRELATISFGCGFKNCNYHPILALDFCRNEFERMQFFYTTSEPCQVPKNVQVDWKGPITSQIPDCSGTWSMRRVYRWIQNMTWCLCCNGFDKFELLAV